MKVNKNQISRTLDSVDLFICSSGFENRTVALSRSLDSKKIKQSVALHMDDTYAISSTNLEKIQDVFEDLKVVTYPKNKPLETFDVFYNFFFPLIGETDKIIAIDITTFTREVLLILLKIFSLDEFQNKFQIQLIYTPAEKYSDNWLTKGVRDIRSIYGYSGLNHPSKRMLLIILAGFESERTLEIIESFEPSAILLGQPSPSESINLELSELGNSRFEKIRKKYSSKILDTFYFSCIDAEMTANILDEKIKKFSEEYNIVISPLNNKISTLGVASCGIKNDHIQICYASANQYNIHNYSEESDYFIVTNWNSLI